MRRVAPTGTLVVSSAHHRAVGGTSRFRRRSPDELACLSAIPFQDSTRPARGNDHYVGYRPSSTDE